MPFINIKGLPGKVYVPEKQPDTEKKNNCVDCFSCQMCSDMRCRACLNRINPNKINECIVTGPDHENKNI